MKQSLKTKKIFSSFLIFSLFVPQMVIITTFPQVAHGTGLNFNNPELPTSGDPQVSPAIEGIRGQGEQAEDLIEAAGAIAGETASCSVGLILAQGLKNFFKTIIGSLIEEKVVETPGKFLRVPVTDPVLEDDLQQIKNKEVSSLSIGNVPILPGLDSIAFCLVNAVIAYIVQGTIEWANRGFDGNPVFLENPERFFQGVADREAGLFLDSLTGGLLCDPYASNVQLNLLNDYRSSYYDQARCTLSEITNDLDAFSRGDFYDYGGFDGYYRWFGNQNPTAQYLLGRQELYRGITTRQNQFRDEFAQTGGFFNIRDRRSGNITFPGALTRNQLGSRINAPFLRTLQADEFDEIVAILVNQLIKIAIGKALSEVDI